MSFSTFHEAPPSSPIAHATHLSFLPFQHTPRKPRSRSSALLLCARRRPLTYAHYNRSKPTLHVHASSTGSAPAAAPASGPKSNCMGRPALKPSSRSDFGLGVGVEQHHLAQPGGSSTSSLPHYPSSTSTSTRLALDAGASSRSRPRAVSKSQSRWSSGSETEQKKAKGKLVRKFRSIGDLVRAKEKKGGHR